MAFSPVARAWGSNELQLCADVGTALNIDTYTAKLQDYLSTKTGLVPAWMAAQAAGTVKKKYPTLEGASAVADEMNKLCSALQLNDELLRYTKVLEVISGRAGPVGAFIGPLLGSAANTLSVGMKLMNDATALGQSRRAEYSFTVEIQDDVVFWPIDHYETGAEVRANVEGASLLLRQVDGGATETIPANVVTSRTSTSDCAAYAMTKGKACYHGVYGTPETADTKDVIGIRLDFKSGQRLYVPLSALQSISGQGTLAAFVRSTPVKGAGSLYLLK